jgi:uncharacterized protein YkwD
MFFVSYIKRVVVNLIDYILVFVVLMAMWSGWQKGFISATLGLCIWLGSLIVAYFFYSYVGDFLQQYISSLGVWTLPVAFIFTLIIARAILGFIAGRLIQATPEDVHAHGINKFMGIFPGFVNGLVYAIIISALLLTIPISDNLSTKTRDSKYGSELAEKAEWIDAKLSPVFDKAINRTLNNVTIRPESNKSVDLHFTVTNAKVRDDLEAQMLTLVNEERAKVGLPALKPDPEMTQVARAHSKDMFARGYFAHITPDGKSPSDRVREAGVTFLTSGENLALAPTLSIAHKGLMNSPGHRANILNKAYGRLGIGILDGGMHGLMVTQSFRN